MNCAKYVNPVIGTVGGDQNESFHGGGKTYPGACVPGGMVQLSPDTLTHGDNGSGYNYCNNTIEGFSFNHMSGIGWYGDLGNLQVMPVVGDTDLRSGTNDETPLKRGTIGWRSEFKHENEHARAGYYSVQLERYDILAEATASTHAGLLRFTYPSDSKPRVLFNFSRRIAGKADFQNVHIVDSRCIEGEIICTPKGGGFGRGHGGIAYNLYFCCEFSRSAETMRFFSDEMFADKQLSVCSGEDVGLCVEFPVDADNTIVLRCGISYTDLNGARNNLHSEIADFNFDTVAQSAFNTWNDALSVATVQGSDESDKTLFYSCLYHALLDPRTFTDADGRFRAADGTIEHPDYTQRTMFSGWDVYRSEFPLLTLLRPDIVNDEVNSLLYIALKNNCSFPRWELMGIDSHCMIGDSGLLIVADAFVKGIQNYNTEQAYDIARASCTCAETLYGKPFSSLHPNNPQYKEHAYCTDFLSETLEFLTADYAMAQFAKAKGHPDDANYFAKRVEHYPENFNRETGFMGPRDKNGKFLPIKDRYDTRGCRESNIFQQSWYIPYNPDGILELFGKERAIDLLEQLFQNADLSKLWNEDYNHSNEPCHNLTHFFNHFGLYDRTQYWTRRVQKEAYKNSAYGFCGNEDVGQLSAWYVLSALGLAQICPANPRYQLNTPLFRSATVQLSPLYHSCKNASVLTIECDRDPLEYPYIQEIDYNGERLDRSYITYDELTAGGKLSFRLSKTPCKQKD